MNRIESGTTGERWVRCLLLVALCVIFGTWFAYDGWVSYPAKNLEWALQAMPPRPADAPPVKAVTNPNVTTKNVRMLLKQLAEPATTLSESQLVAVLGTPAYENRETGELLFIGPAVFVHVKLEGGQVRQPADIQAKESSEHTEADISNQKSLSMILVIVVVVAAIQFVRIVTTRVILDDEGLNYNGKRIPWDAMTALDAERYHDKGWVELEFKDGENTSSLRIDNYKVQAFKEIVNAICDRKGLPNPLLEPDESEESDAEPPAEPPES